MEYAKALSAYRGNMLLISISNSSRTKEHSCIIERG